MGRVDAEGQSRIAEESDLPSLAANQNVLPRPRTPSRSLALASVARFDVTTFPR